MLTRSAFRMPVFAWTAGNYCRNTGALDRQFAEVAAAAFTSGHALSGEGRRFSYLTVTIGSTYASASSGWDGAA